MIFNIPRRIATNGWLFTIWSTIQEYKPSDRHGTVSLMVCCERAPQHTITSRFAILFVRIAAHMLSLYTESYVCVRSRNDNILSHSAFFSFTWDALAQTANEKKWSPPRSPQHTYIIKNHRPWCQLCAVATFLRYILIIYIYGNWKIGYGRRHNENIKKKRMPSLKFHCFRMNAKRKKYNWKEWS